MPNYFSRLFTSLLEKKTEEQKCFSSDSRFDQLYPFSSQVLANKHWTPIYIAKKAARFLAVGNAPRILDIGSGVGKFCLTAAFDNPNALLFGVEQRKGLCTQAETVREKLNIKNACFIHENFTQLDFRNYDHFYFFNPFYENLITKDKIDANIEYSGNLFNYYNNYLFRLLKERPLGTRLVTLDSTDEEVPPGYILHNVEMENLLKFWIKTSE